VLSRLKGAFGFHEVAEKQAVRSRKVNIPL
jgi:hypothetical protein